MSVHISHKSLCRHVQVHREGDYFKTIGIEIDTAHCVYLGCRHRYRCITLEQESTTFLNQRTPSQTLGLTKVDHFRPLS